MAETPTEEAVAEEAAAAGAGVETGEVSEETAHDDTLAKDAPYALENKD
jgi:small subunit ribosomal protein S2